MDELTALLAKSERILVFTGAGISVDSGIPDFRSPGGVWSRIDPQTLSRRNFESGPRGRAKFWEVLHMLGRSFGDPEPNAAHHAVTALERRGAVSAIVTQNIDGLHQRAGSREVLELHGNLDDCYCVRCEARWSSAEIMSRPSPPDCEHCGGPIRPDVVVFGDPLPAETVRRAWSAARMCDLCLVLGSSLEVHPAAELPVVARRSGAEVAIVTLSDTPLDHIATLRIRAPLIASLVPAIEALAAI